MFRDGKIKDIIIKEAKEYFDSRGWLFELFRRDELPEGFEPQMAYISATHSNVHRGPHEHREQTDYFCFMGDFKLYLWDNRKGSITYLNKKVVHIQEKTFVIVPPGIVHAYKNIGGKDAIVINFPDRLYAGWGKKETVDEVRYEDDPDGPFKVEG